MVNHDFSVRHHSEDGRSWTDPITNSTFLADVQLEECLKSLLISGKTPSYYLPVFLHEAMHHWCFLSPVGSTLACLHLRATKYALQLSQLLSTKDRLNDALDVALSTDMNQESQEEIIREEIFSDLEKDLQADTIRYKMATALLRPLAEGLALFAQFDATPGLSPVLSRPMSWLLMFSGLNSDVNQMAEGSDQIEQSLIVFRSHLVEARGGTQTVTSKSSLLVKRLLPSIDCYLPGYLFVKRLHRYAISRSSDFVDSDFFLTYLKNFFYHDLSLVASILDPSTKGLETANAIFQAFQERIWQFFDSDLKKNAADLEKEILSSQSLETPDEIGCFNDPQIAELGKERLQTLISDVWAESGQTENSIPLLDNTSFDTIREIRQEILRRRSFMRVGTLPVSVSINNNGGTVISRDGKPFLLFHFPRSESEGTLSLMVITPTGSEEAKDIIRVYSTQDALEGNGEGTIDLYYPVSGNYRVLTITREGKLIGSVFCDPINPDAEANKMARADFMKIHRDVNIEHFNELSYQLLDASVKGDPQLNHLVEESKRIIDSIYMQVILTKVPDNVLDECIKLMSERGYYKLLDSNLSAVKALALIDLCCSLMPHRELITKWLSIYDIDLDAAIPLLNDYGKRFGIPQIIDIDEDRLVCNII